MADNKKETKRSDVKLSASESTNKKDAKDVKTAKPVKKGPSAGEKIKKYLRELRSEFKKITWPTRQAVIRNTAVTIAACAVVGLVVSLVDLGLGAIINLIVK